MVKWLFSEDKNFFENFENFLLRKREETLDVSVQVSKILRAVRTHGDAALAEFSAQFDHFSPENRCLSFSKAEREQAVASCPMEIKEALSVAKERIEAYHRRQLPKNDHFFDAQGVELGVRWTALSSVGLYVPGGGAAYPSSVLMNAIPARVAGVERLAMVVPTPHGRFNPAILAAAQLVGIDEIYRVGGAQAIGALAYGTETIQPVSKIVGPGNAYVASAKAQVFGHVGIDMIAGPSEVLILADDTANPSWLAADLLAQAEHDCLAQVILITDSRALAEAVEQAVYALLETLPRAEIARQSFETQGVFIIVSTFNEALPLVDQIAPEHLEICTYAPEKLAEKIHHAGAIFLGALTPEAMGDYILGPNHVLPTSRSARFSSGLGVLDFMKRTSLARCSPEALLDLGPRAMILARSEGLEAHARSIEVRLSKI